MKIAVIGATGMVGSAVAREAVHRGHTVTAVSRHETDREQEGISRVAADANDERAIRAILETVDVAVVAIRPRHEEAMDLAATTSRLLDAAAAAGRRLLVVGGAGALRTPASTPVLLIDDPRFVPVAWREIARSSVAQLRACEGHATADWTYLSPPAFLEPGARTGKYRRGTDTVIVAPSGVSSISVEDLALAILDELEEPRTNGHFTVGY